MRIDAQNTGDLKEEEDYCTLKNHNFDVLGLDKSVAINFHMSFIDQILYYRQFVDKEKMDHGYQTHDGQA